MGFKFQTGLLDVCQYSAGGILFINNHSFHEIGKSVIFPQFDLWPFCSQMLLVFPFRYLRAVFLLKYEPLFLLEAKAALNFIVYCLSTNSQHFRDLRYLAPGF